MQTAAALALLVVLAFSALGPAAADDGEITVSGEQIATIGHGLLQGYLPQEQVLDSLAFVPPAPEAGSARQAFDHAWADQMRTLRGTPRWGMAIRDADLSFPAAASTFSCALGFEITEADTPALYLLLWRSLTDIGLSTYSAKNEYQRERPFMVSDTPICTPDEEEGLRGDGSYPSGHTAVGWGWALILSDLVPDRAEAILYRGRAFGESRNVCNVHWYSDVVAGRSVGSAAVARLQTNMEFRSAMEAARMEITQQLSATTNVNLDCAQEYEDLRLLP